MNQNVLVNLGERAVVSSHLFGGRWFRVWTHAVVVSIVASVWAVSGNPQWTLLIGGALTFPLFVWFSMVEARDSRLHITPLSFYFAYYSVGLGLSAVHVAGRIANGVGIPLSIRIIEAADVAVGYVVYLVASLVLHAALQVARPVRSAEDRGEDRARLSRLITAFIVGSVLLLRPQLFSRVGMIAGVAQSLPLASLCLYGVVRHRALGLSSRLYWTGLLVATAVLVWINLHTASKAFVLFAFIPIVWAFLVRRKLRKFIPVLASLLLALLLFVLQPLFVPARQAQRAEGGNFVDHVIAASRDSSTRGVDVSSSVGEFLFRLFDPAPVGFLVGEVRLDGHLMGGTLSSLPTAFVPRFLWPDKPYVTQGAWFTVYLGFAATEKSATTATGMTAPGELYWNFGWYGLIAGMALIGFGLGAVWRRAQSSRTLGHMLLYVFITLTMANMPDAGTTIVSIVALLLLYRLSVLVAPMFERRGSAPPTKAPASLGSPRG